MQGRIWTVPNQITLLRLGFLPLFLILIVYEHYRWALLILVLAGLSDGIDGLLARRLNQKSAIGAYLDPIADKLLLSSSFVILAMEKKIAWWLRDSRSVRRKRQKLTEKNRPEGRPR